MPPVVCQLASTFTLQLRTHLLIKLLTVVRSEFYLNLRDLPEAPAYTLAKEFRSEPAKSCSCLHARLRSGRYYAPPVKRTYVPKEDGSQGPMGMPAFEDKIVQRAMAMLPGGVGVFDVPRRSPGVPGRGVPSGGTTWSGAPRSP
jgi:hypothetical protein